MSQATNIAPRPAKKTPRTSGAVRLRAPKSGSEAMSKAERLKLLERFKGEMRPEIYDSMKDGVERFDALYRHLAK